MLHLSRIYPCSDLYRLRHSSQCNELYSNEASVLLFGICLSVLYVIDDKRNSHILYPAANNANDIAQNLR